VNELRALAAAFTFMTRLPLGCFASHGESDLRASAAYFPVVGIVVGAVGGAAYAIGQAIWPTLVAVLLSMAATVFMTGAFHEDALADTFDGFGGGRTPERVLEIMKDSRIGSYALVGVVLVLAMKFGALFSIGASGASSHLARALIAGHVLARWSSVPLILKYSYVRSATTHARLSAGGPFSGGIGAARAAMATAIAAISVAATVGLLQALLTGVVAALVTLIAGLWFERSIGGITGDTLGAANQLVDLSVYLTILACR
jgi:adenosylcobinamide-GDP ribazoletransferase